jgi:hypothetical protein
MQRLEVVICVVLMSWVFGLDDNVLTPFLSSPRVMLVCGILVWMRCEWRVGQWRVESNRVGDVNTIKQIYELSQTILNLSDQHKLLCDIRTSVLKTSKYSRDALLEIRCPVCNRCSSSSSRHTSVESSPNGMPDCGVAVSPLVQSTDATSRAKAAFRQGSLSESCLQSTDVARAKAAFRLGGLSESCVSLPLRVVDVVSPVVVVAGASADISTAAHDELYSK